MADRKMCTSGNVYLECKNLCDLNSLLKELHYIFIGMLEFKNVTERVEFLNFFSGSEQRMTQFIIEFINCDNDAKLKKKKERLVFTKDIFVLVFDNLESVIQNQPD